MRQARFHSMTGGAVAALLILLAVSGYAQVAIAGDPDGPGGGHHANGYEITVGAVVTPSPDVPMIQPPQFSVPISLLGDPDNPTGHGTKISGDPDGPQGKKNGSPGQILSLRIERISRSQVLIHVAMQGDPDNPMTEAQGFGNLEGGYRLNAYDVSGRLRRQWDPQEILGNGGSLIWNMTDGQGSRLASGIYFVRFEARGTAVTQRVLALR